MVAFAFDWKGVGGEEEVNPNGTLIALASVTDKTHLEEFCRGIEDIAMRVRGANTHLLSTGGTQRLLESRGLIVQEVSNFTGDPEKFDGRLKTLHPKVHGGYLERPWIPEDAAAAKRDGIHRIGLMAVNLYNFSGAVRKFNASARTVEDFAKVMEQIDIGGPSMLRSAAKWSTTVIMNPGDYDQVLDEMGKNNGDISPNLEAELKMSVFKKTASYDRAISRFLETNFSLYVQYQEAMKAIIAGERAPFKCWTEKH